MVRLPYPLRDMFSFEKQIAKLYQMPQEDACMLPRQKKNTAIITAQGLEWEIENIKGLEPNMQSI